VIAGFGNDEFRVMHRQRFAASVVNHRPPFALHLAHVQQSWKMREKLRSLITLAAMPKAKASRDFLLPPPRHLYQLRKSK
jgi:hypothetical protein